MPIMPRLPPMNSVLYSKNGIEFSLYCPRQEATVFCANLLRIVRSYTSLETMYYVSRTDLNKVIERIDVALLLQNPDPDIPCFSLQAKTSSSFPEQYKKSLIYWKKLLQDYLDRTTYTEFYELR